MKSSCLRRALAVAALCLITSLPRLGATVVQTGTITAADWRTGLSTFQIGGNWIFDLHDPASGPLNSVTLEIETAVNMQVLETNFFGTPLLFAPNVQFQTYFALITPDQGIIHDSQPVSSQSLATPFSLDPNESRTVTHNFVHRTTYTADPAILADFIGTGNGQLFLQASVTPLTDHGTTTVAATTTARLTFNVTDAGGTAGMMLAGLSVLGLMLRRRFHGDGMMNTSIVS